MSPLLVFAICIVAATAVGYLRSLELAKPLPAGVRVPRLAPKRAAVARSRPAGIEAELEQPKAA